MNYIYTKTSQPVVNYLSETIADHLRLGDRVLWLISGGSNIPIAVAVAKTLRDVPVDKLYISLVDERYGEIGHVNENWQQLLDQGFNLPKAVLYRLLIGRPRRDTASAFGQWLGEQFGKADYSIGLLGIGNDGHTSGIKAGSEAVSSEGWAIDYSWDDYERITATFDSLKRLDEVVTFAIGEDKATVIRSLLHEDIPLSIQPAQVLKLIKKSILYTDYKED